MKDVRIVKRSTIFCEPYHIVLQLAIQHGIIKSRKAGADDGNKKRKCNGSCSA